MIPQQRAETSRRRLAPDQAAVSPVIGTVLVLMIVMLAMAGIMLWGVPAIRGLQDQAEFDSMITQMMQLNGDLRTLRDPQNTRLVTIAMNQGTLGAYPGSRWVVTAYPDATPPSPYTGAYISGWEVDTEDNITVNGLPGATNVTVHEALGGVFDLVVRRQCSSPCDLLLEPYRLQGNVTRIQLRDVTTAVLVAESWIYDAGRITWNMKGGQGGFQVHVEQGALFSQQHDDLFIERSPAIKEPEWSVTPKDTSFVVRIFEMQGNTVAAGSGKHNVLANLIDNYGITRGRPSIPAAVAVRLQVDDSPGVASGAPGLLEEAFCNYYAERANWTQAGGDCAAGDVNLLYNPDDVSYTNNGRFAFELNHGLVRIVVRQF